MSSGYEYNTDNILEPWSTKRLTQQKEGVNVPVASTISDGTGTNLQSGGSLVKRLSGFTTDNVLDPWSNRNVAVEEIKQSSAIFGLDHEWKMSGFTTDNVLGPWSDRNVAVEEIKQSSAIFGLAHEWKMSLDSIPDNILTSDPPDCSCVPTLPVPSEIVEATGTLTPSFCSLNRKVDQDFKMSSQSTLLTEYAEKNPKDYLALLSQPSSHTEFMIMNYCSPAAEKLDGSYLGALSIVISFIFIIFIIILYYY
jgi:hypothetical protein